MGWIGSLFIALGVYLTGRKLRIGWLSTFTGEFFWGMKGYETSQWDLVALSSVFAVLYLHNFRKWKT